MTGISNGQPMCEYVLTVRDGNRIPEDCQPDPSRTVLDELEDLTKTLKYKTFGVREPHFIVNTHRNLFLMHEDNREYLLRPCNSRLMGRIELIENGSADWRSGCGWKTNSSVFTDTNAVTEYTDRILLPILVPESEAFQHFIDGALPKIIQAYELIQLHNVTLLLHRPRDKAVEEILRRIGIRKDWVEYHDYSPVTAKYLINSCVTPPLHPYIWKKMRRLMNLGEYDDYTGDQNRTKLVVLSPRYDNLNSGRRVRNMDEVLEYMHSRYGKKGLVLFQKPRTIRRTIRLFSRTKIFLGMHGGAMYNHVFAPRDMHIVEFMPTEPQTGHPVPTGTAHAIIWQMSSLIGQPYWRIPVTPLDNTGDVILEPSLLAQILNTVEHSFDINSS